MTNQTKHTPAPWGAHLPESNKSFFIFNKREINNPASVKHIAAFSIHGDFELLEEDKANAQLIAAAPELLDKYMELEISEVKARTNNEDTLTADALADLLEWQCGYGVETELPEEGECEPAAI